MTTAAPRATIAVVGLGSVGGIVAATLQAAGTHDVIVCTPHPVSTLYLERPEGDVDVPLRTFGAPSDAAVVDWVLLCTKTYQTDAAAPWLERLCGPSTRVAVLQNGIDRARRVGPLVGDATVVPTLVYFNAERIAQDRVRVRHGSNTDFVIADDADGRNFALLFAGSPLQVATSLDLTTLAWRKLLLNVTVNPITALTLQRQGVMRRDDIRSLCLAILEEAIAVGCAEGANFAANESDEILARFLTYPADAGTSMYFDRLAGQPLEADDLTGAVVAAGVKHGIATPVNSTLLALLRSVSESA